MKDILFKEEDFIFSFRVSGVLRNGDYVLLQRGMDGTYATIGGHVSGMEYSRETLVREYMEELHANIEVDDLFAVCENFFSFDMYSRPCHQVNFFYNVHLVGENKLPMSGEFRGIDEFDDRSVELDYCWVHLDEIRAGLRILPHPIGKYILDRHSGIVHFTADEREI